MVRWVLLWGAGLAAAMGGCGGKSRDEGMASDTVPTSCQGSECAGLPCVSEQDCPDGSLHYEACLPRACGLENVCHYAQITAGIGSETLICGCDGKVAYQRVGNGSPPAVFAYAFRELKNLCYCASDEVCERSVCADAACDATLREEPPVFTSLVGGSGLSWPDGVQVVVFDAARESGPAGDKLIVGAGAMSNGTFAFAISPVLVRPTLLVDENADAACNAGEVVLRYYLDFRPSDGQIIWMALADEPPLPCEERLPVH